MLHIILLILKIIGIIIALLLLLLLLILFVPIRYECKLDYFESGNGWIKLHWLLHSISGKIIIEQNNPKLVIKLFGFPIRFGEKEAKKIEPDFEQESNSNYGTENTVTEELPDLESEQEISIEQENQQSELVLEEPIGETADGEIQENRIEQEKISFLQKIIQAIRKFWKKIFDIPARIRSLWENIKKKCIRIVEKATSSKRKMKEIKEILLEENSRQVYAFLKIRFSRFIRYIRPKKFHLYLRYGFEDPALTGEITGIMAVIMSFNEKAFSFVPNFQHTVLEGSLRIKGRVQIVVILWTGIRIVFYKQFRVMIKKLMGKIK